MARKLHQYDAEYKSQAVKLAQELGSAKKAAMEQGISSNTRYGWFKAVREGRLDGVGGAHTPQNATITVIQQSV